jgi:NAD(P)H-dependent FMN reductase
MALKTVVVYGSVRSARQGIRAARFIVGKLEARGHEVAFIDPLEKQLPLLDRMYKEFGPGEAPEPMEAIAAALRGADGFIIVSGEYNHSIPPALKNLLDHFQKEYHYKPSGIVTYSAGPFAGLRGLANLRAILGELGTPSIPTVFPVSQVQKAFDADGNAVDAAYDDRVVRFLDEFEWYSQALRAQREKSTAGRPAQ